MIIQLEALLVGIVRSISYLPFTPLGSQESEIVK